MRISFWVYAVWLALQVVFENSSCPNPDLIPTSKFSFLKIGPNTKLEIFENFKLILQNLKRL